MTGGAGRDIFIWQAGEGGSGGKNAGIEVNDTITDFTVDLGVPGNNDALDFSALITTATTTDINIQFTAGTDTTVQVDFDGQSGIFDNDFTPSVEVVLENVNLFTEFSVAPGSHQDLIDAMVANNNLIV